jgi:hypothetical protein
MALLLLRNYLQNLSKAIPSYRDLQFLLPIKAGLHSPKALALTGKPEMTASNQKAQGLPLKVTVIVLLMSNKKERKKNESGRQSH